VGASPTPGGTPPPSGLTWAVETKSTVVATLGTESLVRPAASTETRALARRILVALDGSAPSRNALDQAVRIAHCDGARLTIASTVARTPRWTFAGPFVVPFTPEALRRACEHEAETYIARAREHVPDAVSVTTRILRGRASSALIAEALAGGYDLVVAGSRPGRVLPLLRRWEVSNALVRRCPVSVLVVRSA
jgi:nucleotide-binding universal stress UspA family protein